MLVVNTGGEEEEMGGVGGGGEDKEEEPPGWFGFASFWPDSKFTSCAFRNLNVKDSFSPRTESLGNPPTHPPTLSRPLSWNTRVEDGREVDQTL